MLPTVDVTAGTMEDDPTADGTKEEPARFGEDGHLALEHLPAVSLTSDASGLRDELVAEACAEFLAKFASDGSVYRCEACPVFIYFSSATDFWIHFNIEHLVDESRGKEEAEKYRRAHPDFRVQTAPKVRCKACGSAIRCDKDIWVRHLKRAHQGMTLEEYFVRCEFVPLSSESEKAEGAEPRTDEESKGEVNKEKDEEERTVEDTAFKGSTPKEGGFPTAPESERVTNSEYPTQDCLLEQDEVNASNNEENQNSECSLADMKIEEVRSIDPHVDDPEDYAEEIALHTGVVTEEHPIIIGPENPDTHVLNQLFLNILKLQEMRERYNRCLYECQICLALFDSLFGFVSHLHSRHEINHADHNANHGRAMVMENYSFCEFCYHGTNDETNDPFLIMGPSQFFCDGSVMQSHLLEFHGLNLLQYDKIVRGEDLWYDTCVYRCRLCPSADTFAGAGKFDSHFAAKHAGGKKKAVMALVCKSSYECVICQEVLPGVPGVFDQHVSQKHGLAAADYLRLFVMTLLHPRAKVVRVEVPAVEVPEEWYNACLFKCSLCNAYLNGSGHLAHHVDNKHGMPFHVYR